MNLMFGRRRGVRHLGMAGLLVLLFSLPACALVRDAGTVNLDAGMFDGAVLVDPSVMRGADFPHWASCRTYDSPAEMCTELPKP